MENNFKNITQISKEDKKIFNEFSFLLNNLDDFQKKAIISSKNRILCIAGPGSGKTSVLTKRIEFLVKYRGTSEKKILAITFTKKARDEMQERLSKNGIYPQIETFNSFCEKIILKNHNFIYNKKTKFLDSKIKNLIFFNALLNLGLSKDVLIEKYFPLKIKKIKTSNELLNILIEDCFSLIEYFKSKEIEIYDFSKYIKNEYKEIARIIFDICNYMQNFMRFNGFRDYSDQIKDTISFFEKNKSFIPHFEHVLVDEYQDVNSLQIKILDLLNPKNLFCVGDPRQSIFGWRGSNINYILDFNKKYPDSEIIFLTKNYRSNEFLIKFFNLLIKEMNLPDLEPFYFSGEKNIFLYNFDSEEEEYNFIINNLITKYEKNENIFILARTNIQLIELASLLKQKNIKYTIKSENENNFSINNKENIVLSTIHSIKGLEADKVIIIGCSEQYFPCKYSEHPIFEFIKENYDKENEEKRLFYVGVSRAKKELHLTYSGKKLTPFINDEILEFIKNSKCSNSLSNSQNSL